MNGTELQLKAIFTSHLNSFTLVPPLTEGPGDAAVLRLLPLLLNEIGVGGGSKPSQENPVCLEKVNFSRMKKNEAVFKWVSQLFHSDAKDSVMVFVAVKDDQHIKKLH